MERDFENELLSWKDDEDRLPLMIRGARQVGKSFLVQKFGEKYFDNFVEINFEYDAAAEQYFETLDPVQILNKIRLTLGVSIVTGKTLLFLDEIQICKRAILALRYFYEKMPGLHVIAAGSLLEFTLSEEDLRVPVGRIQYLFMKPLSFCEYLTVKGFSELRSYLDQVHLTQPIEPLIHDRLLNLAREYMVVGGMPKVVSDYLKHADMSRTQRLQSGILTTYQDDFGKYASSAQYKHLQLLFNRAPRLIARKFEYKEVNPEVKSREIKAALEKLRMAGLIHVSHAVSASGIPLGALIKEKQS